MISHRQMGVVGLEGVVGSAEKASNIKGVIFARIEIGVVANVHGHMHGNLVPWDQTFLLERAVTLQSLCVGCVLGEYILEVFPDGAMDRSSQSREVIESRFGEA